MRVTGPGTSANHELVRHSGAKNDRNIELGDKGRKKKKSAGKLAKEAIYRRPGQAGSRAIM